MIFRSVDGIRVFSKLDLYYLLTSWEFYVLGVWHSKQAKEGEVCAVDVNEKNKLVAMGNSRGYISLFRHPCSKPGVSNHL